MSEHPLQSFECFTHNLNMRMFCCILITALEALSTVVDFFVCVGFQFLVQHHFKIVLSLDQTKWR